MATQKVILQWAVDGASLQAAKAANASIRQDIIAANAQISLSYEEAEEAAKSVGLSTDEFIKRTGVAVVESRALADAQDNVAVSTQAAADATDRLALAETKAAAAASLGDKLRKATAATINLPGIGFGSPVVLGLRGASVVADATGGSILGFGAAIAGIAAVAIPAVVAINAITEAERKRTEAAKSFVAAVGEAAGRTSADLQTQINNETIRKAAFESSKQATLEFQDRIKTQVELYGQGVSSAEEFQHNLGTINAELYDFTGGMLGLKDGVGIAVGNVGDFKGILDLTQTSIDDSAGKIAFLNSVIESGGTAAADAAEAVQFFTDGFRQLRPAFFEVQQAGEDFIAAIRAKLQEALDNLNETANSAVDAYMDALQQEVEARDKITEINQQIADLQADAAQKIADAYADRAEKIADAEAEAGEKRADIIADGLEKVRQIEKDFARDYTDAVGNRDAVAAYKAKLHRDDELEKQAKADAKRLADVEKALKKQQDAIEKSYNKQVENVTRALNKQLQVQSAALQAANAMLQNALANEAILVSQSTNLHVQYWNDISYITQTGMSQVAGLINGWWGLIRTGLQQNMNGGNVPISSLPTGGTAFVQNVVDARLTQVFNRMGRSGGGLSHVS